uniref:major capsid protein n=1 Tax=Endozoicomonas sp. ONNA1 TaxID=2828740 RepID=UPI0021487CBD
AYGNGNKTASTLDQLLSRAVKVDGRIGPVKITQTMMKRIGSDPEEAAAVVAAQAAEAMIQDYLNTAALALLTAIGTVGDLVHDASGESGGEYAPLSLAILNQGNAKMGDRSQQIVSYLMHSVAFHELLGEAINNDSRLFALGDLAVYDGGLGRRYIVSDVASLVDGQLNHTLALTPGAAAVQVSGLDMESEVQTGGENITRQMQGEYDFVTGLKGFGWADNTAKSPTDAQIGTAAKWEKTATSIKDCAGVLITSGKKPA